MNELYNVSENPINTLTTVFVQIKWKIIYDMDKVKTYIQSSLLYEMDHR